MIETLLIAANLLWAVAFVAYVAILRSLARRRDSLRTQRDILLDALEDLCRETCGDPPSTDLGTAAGQCLRLLQSYGRVYIVAVGDGRLNGRWIRTTDTEDDE